MLKEPEAALRHRPPSRGRYRRLVLGANIVLAAGALVGAVWVFPEIGDPAVPLVASRLARGEKYEPALLREIIAANLPGRRTAMQFEDAARVVALANRGRR
jgi:hypothetical protein